VNTNSRPFGAACGEGANPRCREGMLGNKPQPDPGNSQSRSRNARSPVLGSGYATKLESINCKLQVDCGVQVVEVLERRWTGHRAEGAARLRGQAKAVRNFPHKEVQRRC
jgi:hypothetical protein